MNLCLPAAYKDPKAGLNLKKGCQTLNGGQALALVRTREFPLATCSGKDQRILIKALLSKLTSAGTLINPFAAVPAASGAAAAISVDQGTQLYQLRSSRSRCGTRSAPRCPSADSRPRASARS